MLTVVTASTGMLVLQVTTLLPRRVKTLLPFSCLLDRKIDNKCTPNYLIREVTETDKITNRKLVTFTTKIPVLSIVGYRGYA